MDLRLGAASLHRNGGVEMSSALKTAVPAVSQPGVRLDRFGNVIDPSVSYGRGSILRNNADEIVRLRQTYTIIRERHERLGPDSVYNLTGLIRGFRFRENDTAKMYSYIHFGALDHGELVPLALATLGGSTERHDGFLCNRVSAAILATMMALVQPGDLVLSVVPADRCHPSVKNSVLNSRGEFIEVIGADAFDAKLAELTRAPKLVVISAISPSKHHLAQEQVLRVIKGTRRVGALVMIDDAHMAARLAVYDETPSLALDTDVVVWSLDKHITGPRSGFVAGRPELIREIRAKAFMFGLEAQLGSIVAAYNALTDFNPAPIKAAALFADKIRQDLQDVFQGRSYRAGPGIAISGEDLMELMMRERGLNHTEIAPIEATAAAAMVLLKEVGAVTVSVSGLPGSACVFRLMMYPDGERLGMEAILRGTRNAIETVAGMLSDPPAIRALLMGSRA
jgi:L-seryl-tRNA(Ser) seleniumtransferase